MDFKYILLEYSVINQLIVLFNSIRLNLLNIINVQLVEWYISTDIYKLFVNKFSEASNGKLLKL